MQQEQKSLTQQFSLFQHLQAVASRAIPLEEMVRLIQYDSDVTTKTNNYRRMAGVLGKKKADEEVKERRMPAVSVAVFFDGNGRKAAHILAFTGLALVDLDHVEDVDAALEKIKAAPHTLLAYKTISGEGLRILYRYERENQEGGTNATTWPAAFLKGNQHFALLTGCAYDEQCSDYSRLCGLAHDAEVYVNLAAEPFVITDEEILAANFSGDKEKGKPRKEYPAGTHEISVDDAWPRVEQALQRKGMVYQSGHHHDYVMHAAFLMNRYGVDLDELLQWASLEWSDYNTKEREATIRSCYKKTQEHGTWRLNRQGRKAKETSMITLPEIRKWLRQHVEVIYNLVTDQKMWRKTHPVPLPNGREAEYDSRRNCSGRSIRTPLPFGRGRGWV